jgi:hypothetical protein
MDEDFPFFSTKALNLILGIVEAIEKGRSYLTGVKTKI